MKFTEFFIERPVFSIVLCLFLVVLGIIGYLRLPLREYPRIQRPVVGVITTYPGASPSLMETEITNEVEDAVATIGNIDYIRSFSQSGRSVVIIYFTLGTDIDRVANEVRNNVAPLQRAFPDDVQTAVFRSDPDEDESMILSITDPTLDSLALTDYVNQFIKKPIEQTNGVSSTDFFGAREYAMRIWLDPSLMVSRNICVSDVLDKINAVTQTISGGQIKTRDRNYDLQTELGLDTAEEFNQLSLKESNGYLVRISDIGRAEISAADTDYTMRVNAKEALGLGVIPDTLANPLDVSESVKALLKDIKATIPKTMKIELLYDQAKFIKASLHGVYAAVLEAVLLVILVVILFLGTWRSSLIPIITIPICLIATCFFIYLMGYSINTITLLAFVLAIGLVVDDAIVVLENIYRYIEKGITPLKAAVIGSREILFAIIAMTLTLAIVYAPIGFSSGLSGVLFQEFAFTLAVAVLISGFVAITLTPMMCAYLLKSHKKENAYSRWLEKISLKLESEYQRLLKWILTKRYYVIAGLVLALILGVVLFQTLPKELTPPEDSGTFALTITPPPNSSFNYNLNYMQQIENILKQTPEIKDYYLMLGDNYFFGRAMLKDHVEHGLNQQDLMAKLTREFRNLPGINVVAYAPNSLSGGGNGGSKRNFGLQLVILTNQNYDQLYNVMEQMIKQIKQNPNFISAQQYLIMNSQIYQVSINRNLTAALGVDPAEIAKTINVLLGGVTAGTFELNSQNYDVIVEMQQDNTNALQAIAQFNVRGANGQMIPLSSLVSINAKAQPQELMHFNRMRAAILSAQPAPNYSTSDAINYLMQTASKYTNTGQYQATLTGSARDLEQSRNTMLLLFGLAILFIYFVLAAQFESFIDPFVIMFTVPLAVVGALLTLKITGQSLNIYSNIGLVTLIGLISKHGILITEFANQLRAKGMALNEAIIQAATLRLRPILMTTMAMSIGALPLALATGAGAGARAAIGWVIVGGLIGGTIFSLLVVPVAYRVLFGLKTPVIARE